MLTDATSPEIVTHDARAGLVGPVGKYLDAIRNEYHAVSDGVVADYIPELGKADVSWFGICLVTADGYVYASGDADLPFTIQSISKPFVMGIALEDKGREAVLARIGVEPSGNPFNAIVVDEASNRPFNPMVNSGAIVATGLIDGPSVDERQARIVDAFARYVGHPVEVDEAVFESERLTGDRNRAIGYLMRGFGMLEGDCDETLDLYFRQCSLRVTCRDIATMGATLANRGVNPITGERALAEEYVPDVLSVMSSCGMYDYSGEWVYRVGIPAKSGVSGGILGVLPGQLAIAAFSPPLDTQGNSVRGVKVCERISHDWGLHVLRSQPSVGAVLRRSYRGGVARSNLVRPEAELAVLDAQGSTIVVHELQGSLYFASMESAFRSITADLSETRFVVIDLRRVVDVDDAARSLLASLGSSLEEVGCTLVLAHADGLSRASGNAQPEEVRERQRGRPSGRASGNAQPEEVRERQQGRPLSHAFGDVDLALEWCEDQVLAAAPGARVPEVVGLADQPLLRGLTAAELAAVEAAATRLPVTVDDVVVREGDPADALYFVRSGRVSVRLALADAGDGGAGADRRLAAFGPGMAFGETALVTGGVRTASVVVDRDGELTRLALADLHAVAVDHPGVMDRVHVNLAGQLTAHLARANAQVRALGR